MITALNEQVEEYRQTNAEAHRITPTNFAAPALIWNQAFWIAPHSKQNVSSIARREVQNRLDLYLLAVAKKIQCQIDRNVRIEPCTRNAESLVLFSNVASANTLSIDFNFRQDEGRLTDEQQAIAESDHRIVLLQFVLAGLKITIRAEMRTEYFIVTTFIEIPNNKPTTLESLNDNFAKLKGYGELAPTDAALVAKYLYDGVWRDFSRQIFPDQSSGSLNDTIFKHVLADARGLVLSNETVELADIRFATPTTPPFGAASLVERYLPLLRSFSATHQEQRECSVSYFLDGRAIYFAPLGPQAPVSYLLLVHQDVTEWQRGRLIDVVQLLGTSRLAALRDLSAFRAAGRQLAGLDHYILGARSAVPKGDNKATLAIQAAHEQFNKVTNSFNSATDTDYGLLYRVERSRYYVARFRSNVALLRIWRIEGYQRYDEFVERRLGETFDFIDRLGKRYERATASLSLLDEYNLSIQSNQIAASERDIARIEQAISERENASTAAIVKIQEWGEFFLLAFLVPYYAAHLLALIFQEPYVPRLATGAWAALFVLALFRKFGVQGYSILTTAMIMILIGGLWSAQSFKLLNVSPWLRFPEAPSELLKVQQQMLRVQQGMLDALDAQKDAIEIKKKSAAEGLRDQRIEE